MLGRLWERNQTLVVAARHAGEGGFITQTEMSSVLDGSLQWLGWMHCDNYDFCLVVGGR